MTGKPEWQKVVKSRGEVLAWLAAMRVRRRAPSAEAQAGRLFEELGDQWFDGVERGQIGRRRGRGKAYSETTIRGWAGRWRTGCCRSSARESPRRSPRSTGSAGSTARPRRAVPLDDREARLGGVGHLRLGVGADAPAGPAQPAAAGRAAAERREAAPPRRPGARGGGAARRAGAGGPSPVRDRVLRGPAALGDLPPRVGGRPRRRPDRDPLLVRRSKSDAGTQRRPPIADNLRDVLAAAGNARADRGPARSSTAR